MTGYKMLAALLRVKETDFRLDCVLEAETAIDRGLHVGGAYSAIPGLTALYYGGSASFNVENPTDFDQDVFVLSKGHAVAALAAVYVDYGYIPKEALRGSRGYGAIVKGHPGPILPGVTVATGPLGHGIAIACGYAMARKNVSDRKVYCMVGDGELQEGSNWEGVMLAADRNLSNLCVIVDKNNGQSDTLKYLSVSLNRIGEIFAGYGFRVIEAYADEMESILSALDSFSSHEVYGKPTAIIVNGSKGFGGSIATTGNHKTVMSDADISLERKKQLSLRKKLVGALNDFDAEALDAAAEKVGLIMHRDGEGRVVEAEQRVLHEQPKKAAPRDKKLIYHAEALAKLDRNKGYTTYNVVKDAMSVFAEDDRLYTIDSDLSNASGLFDGTLIANRSNALNVGIAECSMMCVAEALASEGANVITSTFSPFFDERALRRIGVSFQEREEAIESGWLSEGHNLDITFLATSGNLEAATNGATHMGNDDGHILDQLGGYKVIDAACPQFLQAVLKWIAEGNRGLVYLRTMKTAIAPIYPADFVFEYGKAYCLRRTEKPALILATSGHGVAEALKAAQILAEEGIEIAVLDIPSEDRKTYAELASSEVPVLFAEQNNGLLADRFGRFLVDTATACDMSRVYKINLKRADGSLQYIQSGTYDQLIESGGLKPEQIADFVKGNIVK